MHILTYNIECTILATFLTIERYLELDGKPTDIEYFKLDPKYFTNDFNKMICERLNKQIDDGLSISLLEIKIEAWIRDKKPEYAQSWFNIMGNCPVPMSVAKQYYEEIKINEMERLNNVRR